MVSSFLGQTLNSDKYFLLVEDKGNEEPECCAPECLGQPGTGFAIHLRKVEEKKFTNTNFTFLKVCMKKRTVYSNS